MSTTRDRTTVIVGRDRELGVLLEAIEGDAGVVCYVHGIAGIGKTTLLGALRDAATARGYRVVVLDCAAFEPTPQGMIGAACAAAGVAGAQIADLAAGLGSEGVVLTVDRYEVFRISDPWFRREFLGALPASVRVVVAGREPPMSEWLTGDGSRAMVEQVALRPLAEDAAATVLAEAGVSADDARRINHVIRGHPLALRVAVAALRAHPELAAAEAAIPGAVDELTRTFLDGLDARTRGMLGAVSVVRRATVPLLAAMLPDESPDDVIDRVARLPFAHIGTDGLTLHESVQGAVAARLRAVDPGAERRYRVAAWQSLRAQLREDGPVDPWRYTADMLYLLENPAVREAFFPTTAHLFTVRTADADDHDAIMAIVQRHEPAAGVEVMEVWWRQAPETFRPVRDRSGTIVGISVVAGEESVTGALVRADPILAAWWEHRRTHPPPKGRHVLMHRLALDHDVGEAPSDVQAATWLDVKRLYMERRPNVARLYSVVRDPAPHAEALVTLGFVPFDGTADLGGEAYHLAVLDFGEESIDGWLADLVAAELGIERRDWLDGDARALAFDAHPIPLTPLEFGVLTLLRERAGRVVTRAELVSAVWGDDYGATSNVVDVVIRSLRRKLGPRAALIATVRGAGYRLDREVLDRV